MLIATMVNLSIGGWLIAMAYEIRIVLLTLAALLLLDAVDRDRHGSCRYCDTDACSWQLSLLSVCVSSMFTGTQILH